MGRMSEIPRTIRNRNDFGADTVNLPENVLSNASVRARMDNPQFAIDRGTTFKTEKMTPIGDLSERIAAHQFSANQTPISTFKHLKLDGNEQRVAAAEYELDRKKILYNINNRA